MVDSAKCYKLVRGKMARFTKVDSCGRVVPGPRNTVVTEGLISAALTFNNSEGTAISVQNAAGKDCIVDTPPPRFQNVTGVISLCGVNPDLMTMLAGQERWMSATEDVASGFTVGTDVDPADYNFAMELWSGTVGSDCDAGAALQLGYFLLPFFRAGSLQDLTWQNDAINFTVGGVTTQDNNQWGVGPFDVTTDDTGAASPLLQSLGTKKHFLSDLVTLAPPVEVCGAIPLGVPATGATAGIPATLTPANSYPPETLADASSLTASPVTAWTTGQYVLLGDGSQAHWDGSAWVAGAA